MPLPRGAMTAQADLRPAREVACFAWLPVRVQGRWVWRHPYLARQISDDDEGGWYGGWVTLDRRLVPE